MADSHSSLEKRKERTGHALLQTIGPKEDRKLRKRAQPNHGIWVWLGMLGLVGWSVAIPTLLGVAAGTWIDRRWPSRFSWTLMLMMAGLLIGCLNAWMWIKKESHRNSSSS